MKKTLLILTIAFTSLITYGQPPTEFQGLVVGNSSAFIFGSMQIFGTPAETGDWIAAFDEQGNLVGVFEINGGFFVMALYGGPNQLTSGEMFTLRGWDADADTYYSRGENPEQQFGPWTPQVGGDYLPGFGVSDAFLINFDNSLPIELSEFAIQKRSCDVFNLNWTTSSEVNNEYFSIQRSVSDIYSFETIDRIEGAGNSVVELSYTYEDKLDLRGQQNIYYRLKQTDYDGKSSYSNIITAKFDCDTGDAFNASPNPFSGEINMSIQNDDGSQIIVLDTQGSIVYDSQKMYVHQSKISTTDWPSGLYIARYLVNGQLIKSQKLIKQE